MGEHFYLTQHKLKAGSPVFLSSGNLTAPGEKMKHLSNILTRQRQWKHNLLHLYVQRSQHKGFSRTATLLLLFSTWEWTYDSSSGRRRKRTLVISHNPLQSRFYRSLLQRWPEGWVFLTPGELFEFTWPWRSPL